MYKAALALAFALCSLPLVAPGQTSPAPTPAPAPAPSPEAPATTAAPAPTSGAPMPESHWPMLLGAQYTFIDQDQSSLRSPYSGPLSLNPHGNTEPTNTLGAYAGWAPVSWAQAYLDVEKFMGAGVSDATGLAGLTNGDVVREGASGVRKQFYIARTYARFMLPLGDRLLSLDRDRDQIPGTEATTRLELKLGWLAVPDDFDQNRYANDAREQFLNWSLWDNTAWDYAADTRGFTYGVVGGYVSPLWSLKYGIYAMPIKANQETLDPSFRDAHGQNLQLTLSPWSIGTVVRLLYYFNTARMGIYGDALAIAASDHTTPNIVADDAPGRHKYGYGVNAEQPLADGGETGVFLRWGWDDGKTESFAFTEVDQLLSFGAQLDGVHWHRPEDRLGLAFADEGLSAPHREYLTNGGCGFLLCDGALNYGHEQIIETYYKVVETWPQKPGPIRWQLGPDFQYIQNPGYNVARGPVRFWAVRFHLHY